MEKRKTKKGKNNITNISLQDIEQPQKKKVLININKIKKLIEEDNIEILNELPYEELLKYKFRLYINDQETQIH
ncbi:MAG: hypothetical protein K0Q51_1473 [Rickettsiaceae bacterium]|nr:hypothetical protein [Rickettsiaceae bacterium]